MFLSFNHDEPLKITSPKEVYFFCLLKSPAGTGMANLFEEWVKFLSNNKSLVSLRKKKDAKILEDELSRVENFFYKKEDV